MNQNLINPCSLPFIKVPLYLIHSKNGPTVPVEHSNRIKERDGSKDVTPFLSEKSGHVLPEDIERNRVFTEVEQFITTRV